MAVLHSFAHVTSTVTLVHLLLEFESSRCRIIHERGPMIVLKMCYSLVVSWASRITSFRTLKYKHDLLFLLYQINLLQVKFNAKVTDQLIMKLGQGGGCPSTLYFV